LASVILKPNKKKKEKKWRQIERDPIAAQVAIAAAQASCLFASLPVCPLHP